MDAGALPAGLLSVPSGNYYVSPIYVFFIFTAKNVNPGSFSIL